MVKQKIEFVTIEPKKEISNEDKPIVHYKNSRRNKTKIVISREDYEEKKIIWRLSKFVRFFKDSSGIDWVYQGSEQELANGLTTSTIAEFLNSTNPFDFDYHPNNKDLLKIKLEYVVPSIKYKYSRPYIDSYISFIYNDGKWDINQGYDHIDFDVEDFKEGIIKYVV